MKLAMSDEVFYSVDIIEGNVFTEIFAKKLAVVTVG